MEREIKFRGKRTVNGEWAYGGICYTKHLDVGYHIMENIGSPQQVVAETVGQYTGLKDKNGKEVYEGDIIHSPYSDGKPCRHVIEWNNEDARWGAKYLDYVSYTLEQGTRITQDWIIEHGKEIIGNRLDNPELLK